MAGHSKWANIQHRKGRQDEKRGKVWTKIIREITVAAKLGGGDIATNPRLRIAIEKGKEQNMPADNIKRAVDRGTGNLEGVDYEEIRYEGYGIGGVAIIVDCLTDNRTRTVAEVRHAFSKYGGNMGTEGSVAFLFTHCGQFLFAPGASEEIIMEVALESGAEDVNSDAEGGVEVVCAVNDFARLKEAFDRAGLKADMADIVMKPMNEMTLDGDEGEKMQKLLDALEALDDVQEIYSNALIAE